MKDNVFKYDVELAKQVCASMGLAWNDSPDYSQEPKASELFDTVHQAFDLDANKAEEFLNLHTDTY